MNKCNKIAITAALYTMPIITLASAGGGGSSSDGGSSGGGFSSDFSSSGNHTQGAQGGGIGVIIFFIFILIPLVIIKARSYVKKMKMQDKIVNDKMQVASMTDNIWNKNNIEEKAKNIFVEFQNAWSEIKIEKLPELLTPNFHKRIALELSVLNNEGRRNPTIVKKIYIARIIDLEDNADNSKDKVSVSFMVSVNDKLVEVENNNVLMDDSRILNEVWDFVRDGDKWKVDAIHQATESASSLIPQISEFANRNNFFYNPDFGWLMLPNKGLLFKDCRFRTSDINNHVIGYFRDKIVEFYTMTVNPGSYTSDTYLIAQAILPIKHNDIIVRRKHLLQLAPSGMVKHEMESNDFIKEYGVYSDPKDTMETFELLTPNFMEKIMKLPFELNIEVVGNTLYLYTKIGREGIVSNTEKGGANYETMLDVLSFAFDEMKM